MSVDRIDPQSTDAMTRQQIEELKALTEVTNRPIVYAPTTITSPRVQLIERTSKFWKAQLALSMLLILASAICFSLGLLNLGVPATAKFWFILGAIIGCLSIAWLFFAKLGAWWNHG
jgi:hypothetical protein